MQSARREPSLQSRSIHLVPKKARDTDVNEEVWEDTFYLTLRLPQQNPMIPADSLSADSMSTEAADRAPLPALDPATVLRELFELLEDYSPVWYSEDHHDRAVAALKLTMR